jgi:two-component system response regulator TctD
LLLAEDSAKLAIWLARALQQGGYAVDRTGDGKIADHLLSTQHYDALVLDLGLASMDGITVLRRLRQRGSALPVLILTARGGLHDRVEGLNLGADDYLAKPFDLVELEARLHALIRRTHGVTGSRISLGPLGYESSGRTFTVDGEMLALRPREHAALEVLLLRAGKATSKEMLYEKVFSADATTGHDVVEVYIHRLRKKLQASGVTIVTLRGLGYLLEAS